MNVPPEYVRWLGSLGFDEISFGYNGLRLFAPSELDAAQIGYSRSAEHISFCDDTPGAWKPEWIVIGADTLNGDPIILDISNSDFQVMTAMHGEGSWDPYVIAPSLDAFAFGLATIRQLSVGREYPIALEQNPLPVEHRGKALEAIRAIMKEEGATNFWSMMLESD